MCSGSGIKKIKKISHIFNTVKKKKSLEIPRYLSVMEWTHNNVFPLRSWCERSKKKSITLIHVVNLCIWPGQIPPGCAIYPTCSHKHGGNLAKLNSQAVVRETQSSRLKMWTALFWPRVKRPIHPRSVALFWGCPDICLLKEKIWLMLINFIYSTRGLLSLSRWSPVQRQQQCTSHTHTHTCLDAWHLHSIFLSVCRRKKTVD